MLQFKLRQGWRHNIRFISVTLLSLGLTWFSQAGYAAGTAKEYQIKAVYLYNVIGFIQWPKNLKGDEFRLCVLGDDPFGKRLDIVVRNEKMAGKPISVPRVRTVEEAGDCHTVYITQSEKERLPHILDNLPKGILTVSDNERFVQMGGMIEFYINRRRQIRLAVDPETLEEKDLAVSSKLLKISTIIGSGGR